MPQILKYFFTTMVASLVICLPVRAEEAKIAPDAKKSTGIEAPSLGELANRSAKGTLYAVAALIIIFALLKKFRPAGAQGSASAIEIIAKRDIGPRNSLLLVRVDGERFFLASAPDGTRLLSRLDNPDTFFELQEEVADDFVQGLAAHG